MYWAKALAEQSVDADLAQRFAPLAQTLSAAEELIVDELNGAQGPATDIGGYFRPDPLLAVKAMRPSATFNRLLAEA